MDVREFLAKNKIVITNERKVFCYGWKDKRKNETGAVADTKKRFSEVFRGLEKTLYYIWGGVTSKGTRYLLINK